MNRIALISIALLVVAISGCASSGGDSPITPAPDRPTFLYFYTEG
ncbi:MAG: hypothetical protein ACXADB_06625 [Candidatus Hermodarchaeia archaeon]